MIGRIRRLLGDLRRRVDAVQARRASERFARQRRLAKTVCDPVSGTYPQPESCPNTYWIVFLDGSFPAAQGAQTPTFLDRQGLPGGSSSVGRYSAGVRCAHNLARGSAAYVPEGTVLAPRWHNGQWWFSFIYGRETSSSSSSSSSSLYEEPSSSSLGEESSVPTPTCGGHCTDGVIPTKYVVLITATATGLAALPCIWVHQCIWPLAIVLDGNGETCQWGGSINDFICGEDQFSVAAEFSFSISGASVSGQLTLADPSLAVTWSRTSPASEPCAGGFDLGTDSTGKFSAVVVPYTGQEESEWELAGMYVCGCNDGVPPYLDEVTVAGVPVVGYVGSSCATLSGDYICSRDPCVPGDTPFTGGGGWQAVTGCTLFETAANIQLSVAIDYDLCDPGTVWYASVTGYISTDSPSQTVIWTSAPQTGPLGCPGELTLSVTYASTPNRCCYFGTPGSIPAITLQIPAPS